MKKVTDLSLNEIKLVHLSLEMNVTTDLSGRRLSAEDDSCGKITSVCIRLFRAIKLYSLPLVHTHIVGHTRQADYDDQTAYSRLIKLCCNS